MSRKRLHAKRLGRVVATVKNVDPQLLGQYGGPVRAFAGNKSVHALGSGLGQATAGAAGDDPDFPADTRATLDLDGWCAQHGF